MELSSVEKSRLRSWVRTAIEKSLNYEPEFSSVLKSQEAVIKILEGEQRR